MSPERPAPVRMRLAADLANVRVARLVAVTTARRIGLPEPVVDDVRLAVGEACARAVSAHLDAGLDAPVVLELRTGAAGDGLQVDVLDADPPRAGLAGISLAESEPVLAADGVLFVDAVALVRGLADSLEVRERTDGTTLALRWDLPAGVAAPG